MNICKNNADKWEPNWNKHMLDMRYTHKIMSHRPTTMTSKIMNGPELLFPTTITVNIDSPPRTHVYRDLGHGRFDCQLLTCVIGAKANTHDLLARSGSWWDVEIHDLFQDHGYILIASCQPPIHTIYLWQSTSFNWHEWKHAATYLLSMSKGKKSVCKLLCLSRSCSLKHLKCNLATTVGIRLANQSAVLVTGSGAEGALRSGGVTLWHVTWAAASAVALGTAEVTGQSLHSHCLLIRLAASAWVAVVGGVGCNSHLQLRQMN